MLKFEKIPFSIFLQSAAELVYHSSIEELKSEEKDKIQEIYDNIKLPARGTAWSAGYDFFSPFEIDIIPSKWSLIPTGIRFATDKPNTVMLAVPRSGLGFKFINRLANTVGVIDADYQFASNAGHILVKMTSDVQTQIEKGKGFFQAILINYLTIDDDKACATRTGGFGSTN